MSARRRGVFLLAVLVVTAGAGGWWWYGRTGAAAPPAVDLEGVDPEVAEAITAARRELLASPRSAARWGHLGMVLRAHAFGDEANACFREAERLDPAEGRWPYYRGLTLVLTEPAEGLACLRRAVERLEDGSPAPRFRLVEVLLEQGLLDEAQGHLDKALARQPDHPRGRLLLARLAFARQDWNGALAAAEACREDARTRKQAHLLAAEACRRLGQPARAAQLAERGRQLPEDVPWPDPLVAEVDRLQVGLRVRLARADELGRQGRGEEAVQLLNEVLRDLPIEADAWLLLGQVLRRQEQLGRAEQALERAVAFEGTVEGWFQLGVVRVLQGKKREGAEAFRKVVRLKPDHVKAHHNLAVSLKEIGDLEGARKAWREVLRCQPDNAAARQALEEAAKKPGA
jgi:cytochrome c-type biogenesis protein CcmH/NrfG